MSERNYNISNVTVDPAPTVKKGIGIIEEVNFPDNPMSSDSPLMNGAEYITLGIKSPPDSLDGETYYGSIFFTDRFQDGYDNSDLTDGQRQMLKFAKSKLTQLKEATGKQDLREMEGTIVEFNYGPQKDNVGRGEFKSFKAIKVKHE